MSKVAAIFAHPDDEAFGPGGTISKLAKEGEVRIVCVTNGDADEKFNKSGRNNLGETRRQELINSAKVLGVSRVDFLDFHDGTLCNNNYHDVAEKLKFVLDEFLPETILTYDINGVSGHMDHIAVAMISSFLYERLNYIKKLMYYCVDKIHKQAEGTDYFVYFPDGIDRSQADLIVDCKQFYEQKIAAMRCHESQSEDCEWIIENYGEFLKEEYFKLIRK